MQTVHVAHVVIDGPSRDVQELFREFDIGAVDDVLPELHCWAATVDAVGERGW